MVADHIKERVGALIDQRMTAKGISNSALARKLGVNRQRVGSWRKGRSIPRPAIAPALARELDLPLSSISADPSPVNVASPANDGHIRRDVPRIDWIQAGKGLPAADPYPMGHGRDTIEINFHASDGTFALDVRGDSMEPEFFEGDTIVVDPGVKPESGNCVVAELLPPGTEPGDGDKTFKQYKLRGIVEGTEVFDLIPLNPAHDTITVNRSRPGHVIGVVVEHRRRLIRR